MDLTCWPAEVVGVHMVETEVRNGGVTPMQMKTEQNAEFETTKKKALYHHTARICLYYC